MGDSTKLDFQANLLPNTAASTKINTPDLVIITGMSGAGRTEAMHTFEDMGYFCIDNLPPSLLMNLVTLSDLNNQKKRLAVVCDMRAREFFYKLNEDLRRLNENGVSYRILFLDSTDEVLLARFKASRRRHPLSESSMTLIDGIKKERELLSTLRDMANHVLMTSDIGPRELRVAIHNIFAQQGDLDTLSVAVFSFGFKHGMPADADIIMDVRFLPNPYYIKELQSLTGLDIEVQSFVLDHPDTVRFMNNWHNLLDVIMPGYVKEGKQMLSIGIGCTGGQHRSVVLAEETHKYLKHTGYNTNTTHRDLIWANR